jgi:DNA-binding PadR family transcriptional regulator
VKAESTLGYALLGLVMQQPQSGYELRKIFVATPMGIFSDSPGAIYPALGRLERRGWIAAGPASRGGRRRRVFAPTPEGRSAFAEWVSQVPTGEEVARQWDVVVLRFALMGGVVKPAVVGQLLARLEILLDEYLAQLEAFQAAGPEMPLLAQLAFESGVEGVRAQTRWVRRARQRAGNRRKR